MAVMAAFNADAWHTLLWVVAGALFDFCDGLSARLLKAYSPIGKELDSLADLSESEEVTIRGFAARIKSTFYEKAFTAVEAALSAVGSNVNPKLTFCDLSNRLLLAL